ncbi:uncharacterized protein ACA1_215680 [Acanthamoeba castellanii str. Neff]|uniref:Potassium channel tetramerisation-type BTB domain-containing protein n=1 Tax=Acanthamoeba castellanii (strain ATCC 30010 / Neff) TaxID=1257118 RepID=L8GSM3_ACACF|nr:uncharacterized protein ACA1_215680 [Acanthamoeba castellanii str. Neff]ELR15096.1 hypothetical protein ACA1_215680 [Acanthamoeba castellanii str. Neff]
MKAKGKMKTKTKREGPTGNPIAQSPKMQASAEDDGVVDLNVGGTLYSTTRTTLLRQDSMLAAMFSGRHELKRRADGRIFIDRSCSSTFFSTSRRRPRRGAPRPGTEEAAQARGRLLLPARTGGEAHDRCGG